MNPRLVIWLVLFIAFAAFCLSVFSSEDFDSHAYRGPEPELVQRGQRLYQEKNCTACHQLYGLGGYLGPELTTVISMKGKGRPYARAILSHGLGRMPDFGLSDRDIDALLAFLAYVDSTAVTYRKQDNIVSSGGLYFK